MDENTSENPMPQNAVNYGNVPQDAVTYGNIPQHTAHYRNMPQHILSRENYTLTVKEVARMFEDAGVARIERSIINWCQPNRQGVSRLACYFEESERKWYITQESAERAIAEEQAKARAASMYMQQQHEETTQETLRHDTASKSEPNGNNRNVSEDSEREKESEKEILDLKITNRGKDFYIEHLQKEREQDRHEREQFIKELIVYSRKIGELETRLLQLEAPRSEVQHKDAASYGTVPKGPVTAETLTSRGVYEEITKTREEQPLPNEHYHNNNIDHERPSIHSDSGEQDTEFSGSNYPQ